MYEPIDVTPGVPIPNTAAGLIQQTADRNTGVLRVQPGQDIVVEYLDAFYLPTGASFVETVDVRLDINGNGSTGDTVAIGTSVSDANIRIYFDATSATMEDHGASLTSANTS